MVEAGVAILVDVEGALIGCGLGCSAGLCGSAEVGEHQTVFSRHVCQLRGALREPPQAPANQ